MENAVDFPIGVFDSGVGGLTVLKELMETLPNERFIYFGDTARVPYGDKSEETLIRYVLECAEFLLGKEIKTLVIACNTASAYALEPLRQLSSVPVVGVIEPGAKAASLKTNNKKIAVLATKATVRSQVYIKAIQRFLPDAEILSLPCPLLVPFIEEKLFEHPALKILLKEYLASAKEQNIDTALLGCTHYPLIRNLVEKELGSTVSVIDSAKAVSNNVIELLSNFGLLSKTLKSERLQVYVSDDPNRFRDIGETFLGFSMPQVLKKNFEPLNFSIPSCPL